jgi:hypothetical protein
MYPKRKEYTIFLLFILLMPCSLLSQNTAYGKCKYGLGNYSIGENCNAVLSIKAIELSGNFTSNNIPSLQYKVFANKDLAKLEIYVSTTGNNFKLVNTNTAVDNTVTEKMYSYTDSANANVSKLFYKIKGYDLQGATVFSNILLLSGKSLIKIYPNPVSSFINFSFSTSLVNTNVTIQLYSNDGKLVFAQKMEKVFPTQQIKLGNLSNGIYKLVLKSIKGEETTSITIQH